MIQVSLRENNTRKRNDNSGVLTRIQLNNPKSILRRHKRKKVK